MYRRCTFELIGRGGRGSASKKMGALPSLEREPGKREGGGAVCVCVSRVRDARSSHSCRLSSRQLRAGYRTKGSSWGRWTRNAAGHHRRWST